MAKCLYCYKELNGNERDFHKACSKKIFGTLEAPILPYTHNNLNDLARQVIRSQTTLTGVQAKLSLSDPLIREDCRTVRFAASKYSAPISLQS